MKYEFGGMKIHCDKCKNLLNRGSVLLSGIYIVCEKCLSTVQPKKIGILRRIYNKFFGEKRIKEVKYVED